MKESTGDKYATYIFRISIGALGSWILYFLLTSMEGVPNLKDIMSMIFIAVLFFGYALFGNKLGVKFMKAIDNENSEN